MNKELLIEKIYDYIEEVDYSIITTDRDDTRLMFASNDSINKFLNFINSLKGYNFKTIDDVCDFLDWDYCYSDEVFYCEICGEYHFYDEGYYTTEYDIYGIECLEKNINDFIDEFINNSEKALLNEVPKLEEIGFKKANEEFDGSYLRGGKVDDPNNVLNELLEKYEYNVEVIFYITYSTPYDCNYSYYYRIEE